MRLRDVVVDEKVSAVEHHEGEALVRIHCETVGSFDALIVAGILFTCFEGVLSLIWLDVDVLLLSMDGAICLCSLHYTFQCVSIFK